MIEKRLRGMNGTPCDGCSNCTYTEPSHEGHSIRDKNGHRRTLLMLCIDMGDRKSSSLIIKRIKYPKNPYHTEFMSREYEDAWGTIGEYEELISPLMACAARGYEELCSLLLEKNKPDCAYVAYDRRNGMTYKERQYNNKLHSNFYEYVNARTSNGNTALSLAVSNGRVEICRLLIKNGAHITSKAKGLTPLMDAASNGHTDVCNVLVDEKTQQYALNEALTLALQNGHESACILLASKGANVNLTQSNGFKPLHTAAEKGLLEAACNFVSQLSARSESIANDAVNETITKGVYKSYTPLMLAAHNGHAGICALLLKNNASLFARNCHGFTPLMIAAEKDHVEACEKLVLTPIITLPSRKRIQKCLPTILTSLLCFKRACPKLPSDMRALILQKVPEAQEYIGVLVSSKLITQKGIPTRFIPLAKETLYRAHIDTYKKMIEEALKKAKTNNTRQALNPEAFEPRIKSLLQTFIAEKIQAHNKKCKITSP